METAAAQAIIQNRTNDGVANAIFAITEADNDDNSNTIADPNWQVLVFPARIIAEHPSTQPKQVALLLN